MALSSILVVFCAAVAAPAESALLRLPLKTPDVASYGDFARADRQPITTAKFNVPGIYDQRSRKTGRAT